MIDHDKFRAQILRSLQDEFGDDVEINDEQTIRKSYGWIVFYNSKEFLRSGDPMMALISNAPLLCTWDGNRYPLPMNCSVAEGLELLEAEHELARGE